MQVIVPVAPTPGVAQTQPAGVAKETNVAFAVPVDIAGSGFREDRAGTYGGSEIFHHGSHGEVCAGWHGRRGRRIHNGQVGARRGAHRGDNCRRIVREIGIRGSGSDRVHINDLRSRGRAVSNRHHNGERARGAVAHEGITARYGAHATDGRSGTSPSRWRRRNRLEAGVGRNIFAEHRVHGVERPIVRYRLRVRNGAARKYDRWQTGIRNRQVRSGAVRARLCAGSFRNGNSRSRDAVLPYRCSVRIVRQRGPARNSSAYIRRSRRKG